ncbi:retrovirus-related Pol polyprotein from transposon opus [Trichonephila inaurata madagascariensis]|uniref:Retrovirus-related Pol polyprotein from transposon opus n=1 Tax=Trichonephila inaurata madagascariensis TaxID=2747483 RepID=A0A8X6YY28_9ARAC|nr:retrovirus-related Pol polyprotein from transposon opus [Trichonephila inaurata madagascariensis]
MALERDGLPVNEVGIQEHVSSVGLQNYRTLDKEGVWCDISFYLILFEGQARKVFIKEEDWVTNLVGLLPLEITNLIAREPEEKANDYEHKGIYESQKVPAAEKNDEATDRVKLIPTYKVTKLTLNGLYNENVVSVKNKKEPKLVNTDKLKSGG